MASHRGSCLCGEVAYEVEGPLEHAHHCHCSYCRKVHGTPYATGAMARRGRRWLRGERSIARYESSPGFHRCFCTRCGSVAAGRSVRRAARSSRSASSTAIRACARRSTCSRRRRRRGGRSATGCPRSTAFPPGIDAAPVRRIARCAIRPARRAAAACAARSRSGSKASRSCARSCHCGRCRKARGTAHATNMLVPIDGAALHARRGRARRVQDPRGEVLHADVLPDLRLEGAARRPATAASRSCRWARSTTIRASGSREHIWVGSKAPWDEIHDDLPRYDEASAAPIR